jgi:catalase
MAVAGNSGSLPNYPSTFAPLPKPKRMEPTHENWAGQAVNFKFEVTDEDYVQANGLWQVLGRTEGQQEHLVYNVSSHLKGADVVVRQRTYEMFGKVDKELGERIEAATEQAVKEGEVDSA